jgi:alkanesulfonate monooxygenase SsuD/methylene tetrahydromethanopterin reductase-like flavin-dependent oxidoreductase (luciferase family)
MRIGTLLTPVPRRRPWKLARETVSLDRLSNGRLILGVGIGDPAQWEYGLFGEETDAKIRAQQLDEGLEILNGLWSGELFGFKGTHYQLDEVRFLPRPIQQPRIPIWVGGWWPNKPPMRRAARWDGVCPGKAYGSLSVDEWRDILAYIHAHRTDDGPFDAVCFGTTHGLDRQADAQHVAAYAKVGCNWWVEDINPWHLGRSWEEPWTPEDSINMRERVRQGPPR